MRKKENNSFKVEYMYDIASDIMGIKVKRNFTYKETIEMNEGILLDFDEENIPVSLELHDASKRFNVPKNALKNLVFLNMDVNVTEKVIAVNLNIITLIHNKKMEHVIEEYASNYRNIPNIETELCIV